MPAGITGAPDLAVLRMSKKESPHKDENKTAELSKQVLKLISFGTKISDCRFGSERFESAQGREQRESREDTSVLALLALLVQNYSVYLLYFRIRKSRKRTRARAARKVEKIPVY